MSEFLDTLTGLSSAEEFLDFLKVPYDPQVLRVNRLHILKRFHDYIDQSGLPGDMDSAALSQAYARALEHAYLDFVTSNAVTEKVFKVFQQADSRRKASFVPLTSVSRKPS
jgi:nitrogenase-stabilizing/protective protein